MLPDPDGCPAHVGLPHACAGTSTERKAKVFLRQLRDMLKKGANIEEMIKATRSSRRTIFRYLNHLEDAGIPISLDDNKYHVEKSVTKMLRA